MPKKYTSYQELLNFVEQIAPYYPEDIAFYKGKILIFSSVAHEAQAWFE
jgi:hypothetical protein